MSLLTAVASAIGTATGQPFVLAGQQEAGGGCINQAMALQGRDGRRYFVKHNAISKAEMFAAEADGLAEIDATRTIRVPSLVARGVADGQAFLVLEWLNMDGRGDARALGRQLAAMHRVLGDRYGWRRDNHIGATPQANMPHTDWPTFWRTQRLQPQLALAARHGLSPRTIEMGEALAASLAAFFPGYRPAASLLHGDLWGGNHGYCEGLPVLFDPAVYYGDREADLAMTELFGGFPAAFYAAYCEAWPLDPGYPVRRGLYNLYHVLNHYNLFGGGYAAQARASIEGLLAEVR